MFATRGCVPFRRELQREIDPDDAAEEEAMWLADELVSEGHIPEHPEMAEYYPWEVEDDQAFSPWTDRPEALPEITEAEQIPW